ncbi:MAG: hypothetical protein ABC536_04165 [Candidatus Methanosuratincola petrocarbonis]
MRACGLGGGGRRHTRVHECGISETYPYLAFTTNLDPELTMVSGMPYRSAAAALCLWRRDSRRMLCRRY